MKLTILKEYLNESIQHVSKAISNKTTIPILSGIKIDVDASGMTLTASDTDISIQSFIPVEQNELSIIDLERKGSVVLSSKFFVEIVRKLPAPKVEIEVKDHFQTIIRSGSSEIQLVGLDPEEYPTLPSIEENRRIQLPSDLLKSMIKQTSFAVSSNESTPILTGVLWSVIDGKLKLTGCDRHRLASRETQIDVDADFHLSNVSISGKTLNELAKILPDQNTLIDVIFAENQVLFQLPSWTERIRIPPS
jgi:DNA polymerase-3 subunit beta